MLGVVGPVKDLLLAGKLNLTLEQGAQKAVDVVGGLLKPGDDSVPILGQLEQFFEMFRSLQSWDQTPPSAQAMADLLGQIFVGVPADLLQKPYSELRAVLDRLSHVLPEGPELTAWRGRFRDAPNSGHRPIRSWLFPTSIGPAWRRASMENCSC